MSISCKYACVKDQGEEDINIIIQTINNTAVDNDKHSGVHVLRYMQQSV